MEETGAGTRVGGRRSAIAAAAFAQSCLANRLRPHNFPGRPLVSFLLNYFNRPRALARITAALQACCVAAGLACELVVNVDNPHEAAAWTAEAQGAPAESGKPGVPGFVVPVFSADLHETRGYNRAARLARGRLLVLWQDDQLPPPGGQWLRDLVRVLEAHRRLAILGLNSHRLCRHRERTNRRGHSAWRPDPVTGIRWTYAQAVDMAPLAVLASAFHALGGLDEGASQAGDCGIGSDWELCSRAWMAGWQVGAMYLEGRSSDGQPGTSHLGPGQIGCWGRQRVVARKVLHKRYGARWLPDAQCGRVWLLNMATFKPSGSGCPYGGPETMYGNCTRPPVDAPGVAAELERAAAAAAAVVAATAAWQEVDYV